MPRRLTARTANVKPSALGDESVLFKEEGRELGRQLVEELRVIERRPSQTLEQSRLAPTA